MSVQAMTWVLEDTDLPPAPKLIMLSLANHASGDGAQCYPSQATIARETSMGGRTVRRWLAWLETHGWIQRTSRMQSEGRGRSSDAYELLGWECHREHRQPVHCDTLNCDHRQPDEEPTGQSGQVDTEGDDQPATSNQPATSGHLVNVDQPATDDDQPATTGQGTVREPPVTPVQATPRATPSATDKPSTDPPPPWRRHLNRHLEDIQDQASYDLLSVYRQTGRAIIDDPDCNQGSLIALVADYVHQLTGKPPDDKSRAMIAKTVTRNGLIALAGWDKAIGATAEDSDQDRMAYATAVVNRMISEMEPTHA